MTDEATRAQIDAADPTRSTWLSANAGSGKTRVLTDRVARLLLEGVQPQRILCLTYTKAAASEMQNRLFQRLGAWAMMPNAKLTASLLALGVSRGQIDSDTLREARVLFAKAIETPGGLKIQTIHSFCAGLLRRFPLEAQVSPAFREMDDRAGRVLRAEVLEQLSLETPDLVAGLAAHFTGDGPDALLADIVKNSELFAIPQTDADIRADFSVPAGMTEATLLARAFQGDEAALVARIVPALRAGKTTDIKLADALAPLDLIRPSLSLLATLEGMFLQGPNTKNPFGPRITPPTAAVDLGPDKAVLDAWRARVAEVRQDRLALQMAERMAALHSFATPFLAAIDEAKQQRGWLDFDDLIRTARTLLTNPDVAAWVLYRLDGGIDHVLVDEAQDTSPAQWDVVRLLTEEFFAGESARGEARTVFVVGDKKQSIYSFQGADPAEFDRMRTHFAERHADIEAPFAARDLLYSFRSAAPILKLVDAVFTDDLRRGMGDALEHRAFKSALPGRVDLWDWIEAKETPEKKEWHDPVDTLGTNHPSVLLAERIADHIAHQIAHGQITELKREDGEDREVTRPIRPRDFLILVQSRTGQAGLFSEIIRACKTRNLPMAGADRLRVGGELGVRDLVSLMSFLETPQDDLALAEVMRSPLGGLSEQDLFALAHDRSGLLWDQLKARADRYPALVAMLTDLRNQTDFLRPYELLERALTRHGARERLLARLGMEAEEGITALLDQALQYETVEPPSLTGFLTWLATDDVTIRRQVDSEGDVIRVMTVHGAKGLEAPIVILPQTALAPNTVRDDLLRDDQGRAIWKSRSDQATEALTRAMEAQKQRQQEERMRLLYVAMTRAESWLVVCGAGKPPKGGGSWYEIIENGMDRLGAEAASDVKKRLWGGVWPEDAQTRPEPSAVAATTALPDWVTRAAPPVTTVPQPLSPSNLGGAKALADVAPGLSEGDTKARGTLIHLLLEQLAPLPPSDRQATGRRLLETQPNTPQEGVLDQVLDLLARPELARIFGPDALAEVEVAAALPELDGRRISGAIDRLVITENVVTAVDFKSNRIVPATPAEVPDGLLRQMGAYASALAQVYPDKLVETAILWTENGQLMSLPHDIVRQSLRETHIS